jgi:putative phosphoribosyl transferase
MPTTSRRPHEDWSRAENAAVDQAVDQLIDVEGTGPQGRAPRISATSREGVTIDVGGTFVHGDLCLPAPGCAVVVFAHGSGSSRKSPRNRMVAQRLNDAGLGTLLLDLLTGREESLDRRSGELRFDIGLLAGRLVAASDWVERLEPVPGALGYFGASTGAAAALVAAGRLAGRIGAVVSRGGRPDLAGDALGAVTAPTLLIVGEEDRLVLDLNRRALRQMRTEARLETVAGATHLFEEPGALQRVAELARNWLVTKLCAVRPQARESL